MSAATVSRALSAPHKVRPETRRRVMETVRRLDYTPNERARALRTGTARMVLVAVPNLHSGAFFPAVVNAIDAELSGNGYTMIIGSPNGAEEKARRLVDLVYARQIDGVIIRANCAGPLNGRSVQRAGVPIVAISAELEEPGTRLC
ncbi:MAG: LacI family DNA-binding transcriptional regulator [Hyphomicrobiales bacterium]|nr:LacI family DNA-binding transcriptional regulator [Hyphomicrobiales bacterium]MBV8243539.1 LacI family DNA-binding transcriptional regulator [Hyphomicrobiales bacterium]